MKISVFGLAGIPQGKHNLKDPRLDEADKLAEAQKKTYAQVDVVGEDKALEADAILTTRERFPDLILSDLEFVETRLGRTPPPAEQAVLEKYRTALEAETCLAKLTLTPDEQQAVAVHRFHTLRPVVVAADAELQDLEALKLRAFKEAGYICFLTVGGKENRAWAIRQGTTAWEAAGAIHTDIQKGFIRAEIISFEDFTRAGGETPAKRAGKQRLETKNYIIRDCDIVNFRFNK
jgi:hypothetical protein